MIHVGACTHVRMASLHVRVVSVCVRTYVCTRGRTRGVGVGLGVGVGSHLAPTLTLRVADHVLDATDHHQHELRVEVGPAKGPTDRFLCVM